VPKLPKFRPRLGKLQATSPLFVVPGRPTAQGNKSSTPACCKLPFGERRESPSRQLSGLQTREGGNAEKKVAENNQDYNGKGVLLRPHHPRCVRGGAPRQQRAASDTPGVSGSSSHSGKKGPCTLISTRTAANRSVNSRSKCKQFTSRQYVESSNSSTADYDKSSIVLCQPNFMKFQSYCFTKRFWPLQT
jgi:hypothetical protein